MTASTPSVPAQPAPWYRQPWPWILMAGPNAGWLNRVYIWLTGATAGPFNVYTKTGLVLVIACYSFPYMFVFTRSALDLISCDHFRVSALISLVCST